MAAPSKQALRLSPPYTGSGGRINSGKYATNLSSLSIDQNGLTKFQKSLHQLEKDNPDLWSLCNDSPRLQWFIRFDTQVRQEEYKKDEQKLGIGPVKSLYNPRKAAYDQLCNEEKIKIAYGQDLKMQTEENTVIRWFLNVQMILDLGPLPHRKRETWLNLQKPRRIVMLYNIPETAYRTLSLVHTSAGFVRATPTNWQLHGHRPEPKKTQFTARVLVSAQTSAKGHVVQISGDMTGSRLTRSQSTLVNVPAPTHTLPKGLDTCSVICCLSAQCRWVLSIYGPGSPSSELRATQFLLSFCEDKASSHSALLSQQARLTKPHPKFSTMPRETPRTHDDRMEWWTKYTLLVRNFKHGDEIEIQQCEAKLRITSRDERLAKGQEEHDTLWARAAWQDPEIRKYRMEMRLKQGGYYSELQWLIRESPLLEWWIQFEALFDQGGTDAQLQEWERNFPGGLGDPPEVGLANHKILRDELSRDSNVLRSFTNLLRWYETQPREPHNARTREWTAWYSMLRKHEGELNSAIDAELGYYKRLGQQNHREGSDTGHRRRRKSRKPYTSKAYHNP
ncbi:hypothetical protein M011DRAFT_528065 [Sporormia fimetaria CBS 119925]|uniref:Uncharacterized protein n=1 Tax=Sporormia fimetaria CBS 119925 TaxID=1340428 RepID=A0A6A6V359_9PLEO|nr:hypothetical protein M011DRAFT_528065 [Sporormia fimetaria CBS 119925]